MLKFPGVFVGDVNASYKLYVPALRNCQKVTTKLELVGVDGTIVQIIIIRTKRIIFNSGLIQIIIDFRTAV